MSDKGASTANGNSNPSGYSTSGASYIITGVRLQEEHWWNRV